MSVSSAAYRHLTRFLGIPSFIYWFLGYISIFEIIYYLRISEYLHTSINYSRKNLTFESFDIRYLPSFEWEIEKLYKSASREEGWQGSSGPPQYFLYLESYISTESKILDYLLYSSIWLITNAFSSLDDEHVNEMCTQTIRSLCNVAQLLTDYFIYEHQYINE